MNSERRLLFLLPFAPRLDATNGGSKVIAQLLSRLAKNHMICLVYLRGKDEPPIDEQIRQLCDCAVEVIRPWSGNDFSHRWARRARLIVSLMGNRPMWVTDWHSREYSKKVQSIIKTWQPDILQIEFHVMGQYLPGCRGYKAPRLLIVHEPGERAAPFLTPENSCTRLINRYDRLAWRQYERAVAQEVDVVVVFTDRDKEAIDQLASGARIVKIPPGIEIPERPLDPHGGHPPNLLFFGSFIHPPNIDAALRTAATIFPALQGKFPDLEQYIVGDQPPPVLRGVMNEKITVTGRVPDLVPYLDHASIVVAPLRLGGGMRVKILEALSAGKAIVTTPLAIQGLDIRDQEHIILAESDFEFIQAITILLTDPEKRISLANRARAWACENLAWEKSINSYEALYTSLIDGSRPT